jgi:RNA polymerase sigma-70 factor, ECF subfamily
MTVALGHESAGQGDRRAFDGLLTEARSGSGAALGELLERFREFLLLTAETALDSDVRPKVGASDLVQDSLIEAQRGFAGFRGRDENEFRGWLKRILINNLLNQYRQWKQSQRRQLGREVSLAEIGSGLQPHAGPDRPSASAVASRHEQAQALQQAIDRLPDDHRDVIVLRHREQLGFEEIGRRMSRSTEAARMLWYRAFERLASELGGSE